MVIGRNQSGHQSIVEKGIREQTANRREQISGAHPGFPFIFTRPSDVSLKHDFVGYLRNNGEYFDNIPILQREYHDFL